MTGKVKWFDLRKGFGYITDEEGNDVYVNLKHIEEGRTYTGFDPDDEVEFDTFQGKKSLCADKVKIIAKESE